MMKRLRFATWPQVLVMSVVWLGICLGIDFMFNPNMTAKARAAQTPPASVPLSVHLHHLRCKGCLEDVQSALPHAWRGMAHPATLQKDLLSELPTPVI